LISYWLTLTIREEQLMKKKSTLLLILYSCFRLVASAHGEDMLKFLKLIQNQDTSKLSSRLNQKDSTKLLAVPVQPDSAVLLATTSKQNTNLPASVSYVESAKPRSENNSAPASNSVKILTDLLITDTTELIAVDSVTLAPSDSSNLASQATSTDSLMFMAAMVQRENMARSAAIVNSTNLKSLTSLIQLDSLKSSMMAVKLVQDSIAREIKLKQMVSISRLEKINDPDSLKTEIKRLTSDTLKAFAYTRLASFYLSYDTVSNKKKQFAYQNEALSYTLMALHQYSRYDDTAGLRMSFDNLAKIYFKQKKYTQAKWFILQANSLARAKNDVPHIISSLLTLAQIKADIKDYSLAAQDLDEAIQLSNTNHLPKIQLTVLQNYAALYHRQKNYPKEIMMLKKRDSLEESIRKNEVAQLAAQNAAQKKKLDSLNKKKVYTSNIRKPSKNSSSKKIASL
jgi:hypothetical protein